MKDIKVINELIDKYRKTDEEVNENLQLYLKQIQNEKDPKKKEEIRFDRFIPEAIKAFLIADKLNLLIWLTIPDVKELPLEKEGIKEFSVLSQLYLDQSKESLEKAWNNLNIVLQSTKERLNAFYTFIENNE